MACLETRVFDVTLLVLTTKEVLTGWPMMVCRGRQARDGCELCWVYSSVSQQHRQSLRLPAWRPMMSKVTVTRRRRASSASSMAF